MAVVTIAVLKTYFEMGDFPNEQQFINLIDTLENSSTSTYKRYVALLTQAGTAAPVATVLENTLGGTVVWGYTSAGVYTATLTGAFTVNKTTILTQTIFGTPSSGEFTNYLAERTNADVVTVKTINSASDPANGVITDKTIEIIVYP